MSANKLALAGALEFIESIANANPREWQELAEPMSEFERWAKSRANQAIAILKPALEAVQVEPVARDTIAVNLMRLAGLDKHKARECADIVQQIYATPQQSAPELDRLRASNAELTEEIYQLRASRVELLVALQKIAFEGDYSAPEGMKRIARAAIAKATREAS